jgi:hypothetical protein
MQSRVAPDTDLAGYLANLKAGYQISGEAGYWISGQNVFVFKNIN